ncbi:hypothetical protein BREVNS_2455 [Brevinematales bacterium NS]|nr:hypothetical protein BREVNS_2455 [Brevinematales bacterium NS]
MVFFFRRRQDKPSEERAGLFQAETPAFSALSSVSDLR